MPAATTQQPTNQVWQKRIPTIVGLGFLVVALIVGVVFIGKGAGVFAPRASAETTPQNVRLTNVTDTTFTVSFMTEEEATTFLKYGTEENKTTLQVSDDRIQLSATKAKYTLHHITVKGLQAGTTYYYVINSAGALFDNNGAPFKIVTAKKAGVPTAAKTIFGSVTVESGGPAEGSVVYVKTDGAGDMSSLVTNTGSWAVPLSNARTPDGSSYATITDNSELALVVQGPKASQTAQGSITVGDAHPVPTITFGRGLAMATDDMTESPSPTPTTTPTPTPTPTPSPDLGASTSSSSASSTLRAALDASASASSSTSAEVLTLDLTETHSEIPVVTTQQPVITGEAAPNVKVTIEVHSDNHITQEVTADSTGQFEIDLEALKATLEPGEHTVTYTYTDPTTGQPVTTTKTFMVEPKTSTTTATDTGGTSKQLALAATPTPTPFGTNNPYPIGGATASAQASASAKPTPKTSSSSATSTRSSQISTTSGLPVSGAIGTTLALVFGGVFFIIAGTWSYWISAELARKES